ncbi:MAG: hypothetical protein IIB31_05480, partial [Chloroflexi bacterium]|nr:hypothetical protein [Chloroflexota bacterium]
QLSERLQGFIYRYENYGHSSEQIPQGTRVAIRNLFAWLSQRDPDMFATVTEDGLLVLEATLDSKGQLFVEIDRDGTVEATFASSGLDIIGLNVTNISELTYDLVSSIGGS